MLPIRFLQLYNWQRADYSSTGFRAASSEWDIPVCIQGSEREVISLKTGICRTIFY